jgi:hypothetical protein
MQQKEAVQSGLAAVKALELMPWRRSNTLGSLSKVVNRGCGGCGGASSAATKACQRSGVRLNCCRLARVSAALGCSRGLLQGLLGRRGETQVELFAAFFVAATCRNHALALLLWQL